MGRHRASFAVGYGIVLSLTAACQSPESGASQVIPPPPGQVAWPAWETWNSVRAMAVADDGTVYAGGTFTRMGPMTGGGVPLDAGSGEPPAAFAKVDGAVFAVAPDGAGGWYIGGSFAKVGGEPRRNLAHILSDGSLDPSWDPGTAWSSYPSEAYVGALTCEGGVLYVAGGFDALGGAARLGLGAVDASGQVTGWAPAITGEVYGRPAPEGAVWALAASSGRIYLGGRFTAVDGLGRMHLAALDGSGNLLGWDPGVEGKITAMAVVEDTVYVAGYVGYLLQVAGQPRGALAAVDATGQATPWNPVLGEGWYFHHVNALVADGGTLYIGGAFGSVDGQPRSGLAAFDASGDLTAWAPAVDSEVKSLAVANGTVYAGGSFGSAGGLPRSRLAAFDASGAPTPWDPDVDNDGSVGALAASGGSVYAGGTFKWLGKATKRMGLAAIDPNGQVTAWNPGVVPGSYTNAYWGFGGSVETLAVVGGTIYLGGNFTGVGGEERHNLAAVDAAGAVTPWRADTDERVHALAVSGNTIYVGGRFTRIGGIHRDRLAAVDVSGTVTAWNPGANALVTALAVEAQVVYVGGYFTALGGAPRANLGAVAATGALWPWNPRLSAGPPGNDQPSGVWSIAVDRGTLYVAGNFWRVGEVERHGLAAFDASGNLTDFTVPGLCSLSSFPESWAIHALRMGQGLLLAGGTYPPGCVPRCQVSALALLNPASNSSGWGCGFVIPSWVEGDPRPHVDAIAVRNGVAYVGGRFWGSGTERRWGLAAVDERGYLTGWNPNPPP